MTPAAPIRPRRQNEKAHLLQALERRARSERRWGAVVLWVGVGIVGVLVLAALLAPVIFPGGPNQQDLLNTLHPPSWQYPFGTDNLGRDIFVRSIYAARIDLMVGLITTYVPLALGVFLGLLAGYRGGWLETVVMRAGRRGRRLPLHRAGDRRDRDRGSGPARRLHRDHRCRLGALCTPHPRGGADPQGAAVRARRDEPRLLAVADPLPAPAAERDPPATSSSRPSTSCSTSSCSPRSRSSASACNPPPPSGA